MKYGQRFTHFRSRHRLTSLMAAAFAFGACDSSSTAPTDSANIGNRLATGETTTCAIAKSGGLYCWGENSSFLQYSIAVPASSSPVQIPISDFRSLSLGHGSHMCGMSSAHKAQCWGRNTNGQIGNDTISTGSTASTVFGDFPFTQMSASRLTTCGVTTGGGAYCWGINQRGEGGNPSRVVGQSDSIPRLAQISGLTFITAGWLHGCGFNSSGTAYCWGDNAQGQLGFGNTDSLIHSIPFAIPTALRFEELSAGANYTCGITTTHAAYCWGQNATGELGDGTTTTRMTPTAVAGGLKFAHIAASSGFGPGSGAAIPNAIPGGIAHTCALTETGEAYCWGWNGAGQIGDGTVIDKLTPVAVSGGLKFTSISLGGSHTCATKDALVFCWGGNAFGQLGNGSLINSPVPVAVRAPFAQ